MLAGGRAWRSGLGWRAHPAAAACCLLHANPSAACATARRRPLLLLPLRCVPARDACCRGRCNAAPPVCAVRGATAPARRSAAPRRAQGRLRCATRPARRRAPRSHACPGAAHPVCGARLSPSHSTRPAQACRPSGWQAALLARTTPTTTATTSAPAMFRPRNPYKQLVERATDENLTAPVEDLNHHICAGVRGQGEPGAHAAVQALSRRLQHPSANVQILSLALAEALSRLVPPPVIYPDLSSRAFCNLLRHMVHDRTTVHDVVRRRILILVKTWAADMTLSAQNAWGNGAGALMKETYQQLQREGMSRCICNCPCMRLRPNIKGSALISHI